MKNIAIQLELMGARLVESRKDGDLYVMQFHHSEEIKFLVRDDMSSLATGAVAVPFNEVRQAAGISGLELLNNGRYSGFVNCHGVKL